MKLRTYCLACRKHTRKVSMTNKVPRDKSRFLKQKSNKKSGQ